MKQKVNILILGTPVLGWIEDKNKPIRTHLIGADIRNEFEDGLLIIGFSEIRLKSGYKYQLNSCQAIDSRLIKVILSFKPGREIYY